MWGRDNKRNLGVHHLLNYSNLIITLIHLQKIHLEHNESPKIEFDVVANFKIPYWPLLHPY